MYSVLPVAKNYSNLNYPDNSFDILDNQLNHLFRPIKIFNSP